ncbi:hypothetical protein D3C87_1081580 [compost metagenome]
MVITARAASTWTHSALAGMKPVWRTRRKKANEAALTAVAMKPVTGAGAPS